MIGLRDTKVGVVFSSGFFGFFAHAGCLLAMEEMGIKPVGYGGSSSGAIVAAFAAGGMSAREIGSLLLGLKKRDFWDPEPWYKTAAAALKLFKGWSGYLEGEKFNRLLAGTLPVKNFEDLSVPCVIAGCNLTRHKTEVFTSGSIADAVQASGAIPWIFKFKKIGSDLLLDGGLVEKVPLAALAERIDAEVIIVHYIASHNLEDAPDSFLSKMLSPQKAYSLAVSIARREHCLTQIQLMRQRGIGVIELKPRLPRVTPDRLHAGRKAFDAAYTYTMTVLRGDDGHAGGTAAEAPCGYEQPRIAG
jgi:NTE family protein